MNWWKDLRGKVSLKEFLKDHTTFRIGGPAKYLAEPKDANDLKLLLNLAKRYKIPTFVIGAGSNILVKDRGVDGAVLRLNSPYFKKLVVKDKYLEVGAGCLISKVVAKTLERGLSGAEFLAGIPGTMGGALVMNAGAWGRNIGDLVEKVTVMDYNGNIKTLNRRALKFGYRKSNLSQYIILSARIKLVKKNKEEIQNRVKNNLQQRKATQDLSGACAGCVFKNPKGASAGRLIDLCGLKGKKIGGAYISAKHANFIINKGNAKARDILQLMKLVSKEVKKKFNITLEPEIKIWQ
jgi:UDP-N-acetylmuramate dehydrogenase